MWICISACLSYFSFSKITPTENDASIFQIHQNIEYHQNKLRLLYDIKEKINQYKNLSIDEVICIQKMDKLFLLEIIYTYNDAIRIRNEILFDSEVVINQDEKRMEECISNDSNKIDNRQQSKDIKKCYI
jgi:hypothetical protein